MTKPRKKWRSFNQARRFIRSLGLKNDAEWRRYCKGEIRRLGKKPDDIPTTPDSVYEDKGWVSLGNWLGTGNVSNKKVREQYMPFTKARKFARSLKLRNRDEWQEMVRKGKVPKDIPLKPERAYADKGWVSCGDWLGTGYVPPFQREYHSFQKARLFSRKLKLKSRNEWESYCKGEIKKSVKRPSEIPATPARVYKNNGWNGWPDWLGKK